jgi:hypothetical protein
MVMGDRGRIGPRAILREEVNRQAIALSGRAVRAALDPSVDSVRAAHLAVKLIEAAYPREQAVVEVSTEADLSTLGLSQLVALAGRLGIDPSETSAAATPAATEG